MEDWGYKFTVTPSFPIKLATFNTHWMVKLDFELIECVSAISSSLIISQPYNDLLENKYSFWLESNSAVKPELFHGTLGEKNIYLFSLKQFY